VPGTQLINLLLKIETPPIKILSGGVNFWAGNHE